MDLNTSSTTTTNLLLLGLQAVEDVNVTFEDQQKINKFARNTSRMTELKSEIEAKKVSSCQYLNHTWGSVCDQLSLFKSVSDNHNGVWECYHLI